MITESITSSNMGKKLIVPAEVKICATCSYWDGERKVDSELRIVVVDECCHGKCLVQNECRQGMTDEFEFFPDCLWEHLAPDEPEDGEKKN
ncbi:MAG: hypothetical protein WCK63_15660 [Betaproteobacteria bacterium]